MADETTTTTTTSDTTTPPTVTDTAKTEGDQSTIDLTKLTEADFNKIYEDPRLYNHSRFKGLTEAKKERDALKKEREESENRTLAEQKKFEELANKYKTENETLKQTFQQTKIDSAIERIANQNGVVDPEAVLKLIDRSTIQVDETTGQVQGVEEAVKKLAEDKKYLFGKGSNVTIGTPSNPDSQVGLQRFKMSQLQDASFYQAHEKEIRASMAAGLVEDDVNRH